MIPGTTEAVLRKNDVVGRHQIVDDGQASEICEDGVVITRIDSCDELGMESVQIEIVFDS